MEYIDSLYGAWQLPSVITELIATEPLIRLRGISQDTLPASILWYPIPSRFLHGLGVAFLAHVVCTQNPHLDPYQQLLLTTSSFLHDAGSPAFSHGGERFLQLFTGKNGEQFLADILISSDAEQVLTKYDLAIDAVVGMVTGAHLPFAEVLCGTLDIDNADNIYRYAVAANLPIPLYDPQKIAMAFRYCDHQWVFREGASPEIYRWILSREKLYRFIYESPRMIVDAMLQRALTFAYNDGEISEDFFRLTDEAAFVWLEQCNPATLYLMTRIRRWQWYERLVCLSFEQDTPLALVDHTRDWQSRNMLADAISHDWLRGIRTERLSLDLGELPHINSLLIAWLIQVGQAVAPGRVELVNVHPQAATQLAQLRLTHLLPIVTG